MFTPTFFIKLKKIFKLSSTFWVQILKDDHPLGVAELKEENSGEEKEGRTSKMNK